MNEYIKEVFDKAGPIAGKMPDYEIRQEQIDMAKVVGKAVQASQTLIVEAGTGVGKSFSYLIPVAKYVLNTESTAIISTNTINLQEQIIHKDIPFLEDVLKTDFKAVLVKGRRNYLCLRRLHRSNFKQKDLFADEYEMREFARIIKWSYKTEDGSLYDFDGEPDYRVWDMVSANAESCPGKKCIYYKQCFFQKAREKIRDARILITNHHLFFSNMAIEDEQKGILPDSDIIVFDEAHSVETAATEHLGVSLSNISVKYLMDLLFSPKKQKGVLISVGDQDSMEWVELLRRRSEAFFKKVKEYFEARRLNSESDSLRIRKPDFIDTDLSGIIEQLLESLSRTRKNLKGKEDEPEITALIRRVKDLHVSLKVILNQSLDNYVYWIGCSKNKKKNKISLNAAPVNVGSILQEKYFYENKSVILTSATLSVDANGNSPFTYLKERLGIKDSVDLKLGSSFDYMNQVRMYIAEHMPNPQSLIDYAPAVSEKIKKYLQITNGNAFILFTSYSLMNIVYEEIEDYLREKRFNIFKQGSGLGRSRMLSGFKEKTGSVLFGVDSFWQGIDVRGRALSNVIITKLPFAVPDNPVIEARIEEIRKRGGDAFSEYSLPEAVLRFKQGFGRLVRSRKDTGVVVVLDSRIVTKSYGRQFLDSVPKCEIVIDRT